MIAIPSWIIGDLANSKNSSLLDETPHASCLNDIQQAPAKEVNHQEPIVSSNSGTNSMPFMHCPAQFNLLELLKSPFKSENNNQKKNTSLKKDDLAFNGATIMPRKHQHFTLKSQNARVLTPLINFATLDLEIQLNARNTIEQLYQCASSQKKVIVDELHTIKLRKNKQHEDARQIQKQSTFVGNATEVSTQISSICTAASIITGGGVIAGVSAGYVGTALLGWTLVDIVNKQIGNPIETHIAKYFSGNKQSRFDTNKSILSWSISGFNTCLSMALSYLGKGASASFATFAQAPFYVQKVVLDIKQRNNENESLKTQHDLKVLQEQCDSTSIELQELTKQFSHSTESIQKQFKRKRELDETILRG